MKQEHYSSEQRKAKRDKRRRRRRSQPSGGTASTTETAAGTAEPDANHFADDKADYETDNENSSYVFTGMDREIPEEFILHSLEPSKTNQFHKLGATDA